MTLNRRKFLAGVVAAVAAPTLAQVKRATRIVEAIPDVPVGYIVSVPVGKGSAHVIRTDDGWIPCDGRSIGCSVYPALFAVLGSNYGGGGDDLRLPELRGRLLR